MTNIRTRVLCLGMLLCLLDTCCWRGALHAACTVVAPAAATDAIGQAATYRQAGQFAEGKTVLDAALAQQTEPEVQQQLHTALADLHKAWGDSLKKRYVYEEAIAHYEAAIQLDREARPKEAAAGLTALGQAYFDIGQYDQAIDVCTQALALQREHGDRVQEASV